jgi:hypothetical protein
MIRPYILRAREYSIVENETAQVPELVWRHWQQKEGSLAVPGMYFWSPVHSLSGQ